MNLPGRRVRRTRLVRTDRFVVAVEVEAVIANADPSEPCFEPQVVELLRQVEAHAKQGDVEWLKQHGKLRGGRSRLRMASRPLHHYPLRRTGAAGRLLVVEAVPGREPGC